MSWEATIDDLSRRLRSAFTAARCWLDVPAALLDYRPPDAGWTVREICEHITLADRHLLILAGKIRDKSRRRVLAGRQGAGSPAGFEHLEALARRELVWRHPAHMTPTGIPDRDELARRLDADLAACLALLREMPGGEGCLHHIRMSVVPGDDRLDLYQYVAIIALHVERHLEQMERNRAESLRCD